jgi:hypothetical protein
LGIAQTVRPIRGLDDTPIQIGQNGLVAARPGIVSQDVLCVDRRSSVPGSSCSGQLSPAHSRDDSPRGSAGHCQGTMSPKS